MNANSNPRGPRRIILAESAGFCFGVRRAIQIANQARSDSDDPVTCIGPIVHNQQVVDRLSSTGIGSRDSVEDVEDGTAILSAHGVSPQVPQDARSRGLRVVDATCPFVTRVHREACRLFAQGYHVVMLGDPAHTEVRGVIGAVEAVGGSVTVVAGPDDARRAFLGPKVGVVSQTTQRLADFEATVEAIREQAVEVRAINTICGATDELQEAAVRLARQADIVLVIGGRGSANTRRLRSLCEKEGVPAYQIETACEIDESWLEDAGTIGITAGASTPDWIIDEVATRLNGGAIPDGWRVHHPDERLTRGNGDCDPFHLPND